MKQSNLVGMFKSRNSHANALSHLCKAAVDRTRSTMKMNSVQSRPKDKDGSSMSSILHEVANYSQSARKRGDASGPYLKNQYLNLNGELWTQNRISKFNLSTLI